MRIIWARRAACIGQMTNVSKIVVKKLEGKRPLCRWSCRWEDNIKMDFEVCESAN
jgi:hypothetical protein